jgi:O-antigen ligase
MAKGNKKQQTKSASVRAAAAAPEQDMSLARKIAWWSLLAMIFMVPIAMSNFTWLGGRMPLTYDQFDIFKVFFQRVLGLVGLAAWGWDILMRGGRIRRNPVDWLILAFLAWVTLTTILSISPATAIFGKYRRFEGLLSFINYAVIYFLVVQFADRPSRVRTLAKTLFWSGLIVTGYGVMQSVGVDPVKWGQLPFEARRAFSTYGNPDLLGGFLMFSLPITLGLVLSEDKLSMRIVYWLGFAVNVWCWIVAFTRGAWIGGLVSIPLVVFIAFRHRAQFFKVDWVPVGAIGALAVGIIGASLKNPNEVMNFAARFKSIVDFQGGSGKTRTEIWRAAIDAIKDRPLFGFGADTFRLVFPKYKPYDYVADAGYRSVADNVHDYPLQLAAGIGIVGVLLMYGVMVWAAIRSAPLVFKRSDDHRRILYGAFWAACAGYLVQLMFGLSVTGNTFLLWAALGVVLSPTCSVIEVKAPSWGIFVALIGMVLAGLGIGYQIVYLQADHYYLVTMIASEGTARVESAKKAASLNPFNDMYRAEVGIAYRDLMISYLNQAQQAQSQGQDPAQYMNQGAAAYEQAVNSLIDTINFVPWEYDNYVFLTSVHNIAGQSLNPKYYDLAVEVGRKGIEVEPFGPAMRIELARAYNGKGDNKSAIEQAKIGADMDPNYTDAWLFLSSLHESAGDPASALAVLKELETLRPGSSGVAEAIKRLESTATTAP